MNFDLDHEEEAVLNYANAVRYGPPALAEAWQKVLDAIRANDLAAYQAALKAAQALEEADDE